MGWLYCQNVQTRGLHDNKSHLFHSDNTGKPMAVKIKSFDVDSGDMFYIRHASDNFTVIDCNLIDNRRDEIIDEIIDESYDKGIRRFISTHPDEDHFHGIEHLHRVQPIINFYCVKNLAIKDDETNSFKKYCELRDSDKAFYLYKDCSRKWMNKSDDERGAAGINVLWPVTNNDNFKEALKICNQGGSPNNISPIISYATGGIRMLWFGDLENQFMESIQENYPMPEADIVFAPHHGRLSGAIPQAWLEQINPQIIIIGSAPFDELEYYDDYDTITQNSAWDVTLMCDGKHVHIYSSNENYGLRSFLTNKRKPDIDDGYYIGTLASRNEV